MRHAWAMVALALAIAAVATERSAAQTLQFAGRWTLNRDLSQLPKEVGFNADWFPTNPGGTTSAPGGGGGGRGGGGRGRRGGGSTGGGSANPFSGPRISE